MENIAVLTSGGDSPGMNACIRAVVRCGIASGLHIFGVRRGYAGLMEDDIIPLNERSVGNIIQLGGTFLKTARCKEFLTKEGVDKAVETLRKHNIDGIVVIGGDGTFRGANELIKRGIKCACIPATIDNNLFYTDYTIGYDTATNTVVNLINNFRDTSLSHDRVSIIEVMGAGCGDIALCAGLAAGADVIIVPEIKLDIDSICEKLTKAREHGKEGSIVLLSERVCDINKLADIIHQRCGVECRTAILGHLQRGGSPSAFDRNLASRSGSIAVEKLRYEESGVVGYKAGQYIYVSIEEALVAKQIFDIGGYQLAQRLSF